MQKWLGRLDGIPLSTLKLHLSHGLLTPLIATVTAPEIGDCDIPLCPIQRLNAYLGIYPYLLSRGAEGMSLELGRLMTKGIFAMPQHPASTPNIPFAANDVCPPAPAIFGSFP